MPRHKTCSYCGEKNHWSIDGVISMTLSSDVEQFNDNPQGPWFCSQLCCNMAKYELGYVNCMDHKLFVEMKEKVYPNVVFRK